MVEAGAVLGANTTISASIPIIDVTGAEPVEIRGRVPANAVVVPGTRPKEFPGRHLPGAVPADHRLARRVHRYARPRSTRRCGCSGCRHDLALASTLAWLVDIPSVTGNEGRLCTAIAERLLPSWTIDR